MDPDPPSGPGPEMYTFDPCTLAPVRADTADTQLFPAITDERDDGGQEEPPSPEPVDLDAATATVPPPRPAFPPPGVAVQGGTRIPVPPPEWARTTAPLHRPHPRPVPPGARQAPPPEPVWPPGDSSHGPADLLDTRMPADVLAACLSARADELEGVANGRYGALREIRARAAECRRIAASLTRGTPPVPRAA